MALNKFMAIGRIGKKELKYTPAGDAVCTFSVAMSEKYNGEEKTEWVQCVAWKKTAENIDKFFSVGSEIFIEGKIQTRNYEKDGTTRYVTEIIVFKFEFTGGSKSDGNQNQSPQNNQGSSQNSNTGAGWGAPQNNNADGGGNGHAQGCQCPDCIDIPF